MTVVRCCWSGVLARVFAGGFGVCVFDGLREVVAKRKDEDERPLRENGDLAVEDVDPQSIFPNAIQLLYSTLHHSPTQSRKENEARRSLGLARSALQDDMV